jgi:hypothetical protein
VSTGLENRVPDRKFKALSIQRNRWRDRFKAIHRKLQLRGRRIGVRCGLYRFAGPRGKLLTRQAIFFSENYFSPSWMRDNAQMADSAITGSSETERRAKSALIRS